FEDEAQPPAFRCLRELGDVERSLCSRHRRDVAHARVGRDDYSPSGRAKTPAEVDVLVQGPRTGVESADLGERVCTYEQARVRSEQDVGRIVALSGVDLTGVEGRAPYRETVDPRTDLLQNRRVVPVDELRAHGGYALFRRARHHSCDDVIVQDDVVVAQQDVGGGYTARVVEPPGHGLGEARARRAVDDHH